MEKNKLQTKILIDFQEYKLLLKKAELFDNQNKTEKVQEGGSLPQILAKQAFDEGLLKPSNSKG